ncbi:MAG: GIY-YIG nuclease family protein [Spirochaetes bacterium]|nr:GIY-YIG nuclease family protein [Spirochaetota bacterium]
MNHKLIDLTYLILDIQAIGSNLDNGYPLEIGWSLWKPGVEQKEFLTNLQSFLIKLPDSLTIPRQVQKITGIKEVDLKQGMELSKVYELLSQQFLSVYKMNQSICPLIIHYARYEKPFLDGMCQLYSEQKLFEPLIICTHKLSKILFPDLPRKGIRAVAGYLGYTTEQMRRSQHHIEATQYIWQKILIILKDQWQIAAMDELLDWQSTAMKNKKNNPTQRSYPMLAKGALNLPDQSGIYRMLRSNGDLLYIGKARSLKQRVSSYFLKSSHHPEYKLEMLSQAVQLDYTITPTAAEAALLESDEIKKYQPPYNRALLAGERKICYFSHDYQNRSSHFDDHFPLGPLPDETIIQSLTALERVVKSKNPDRIIEENYTILFQMLPEYLPDLELMKEGYQLFYQNYQDQLTQLPFFLAAKIIANAYYRSKLTERKNKPEQKIETDEEKEEKKEFIWTAEAVQKGFIHLLNSAFFYLRRAHWFKMLYHSLIIWENFSKDAINILPIEDGYIKGSTQDYKGQDLDELCKIHWLNRSIHNQTKGVVFEFDIATYDRLRILTTEIRRIIGENRKVEVFFSPSKIIKGERLKIFLEWL